MTDHLANIKDIILVNETFRLSTLNPIVSINETM